ncbi:glycosyltransferase [Harryflintia acetispora]|uniref:Cellulose synthase/poly-beta-1,6-N-acetylglucosamine synthase-like glycosyltransferase n=1 Tax=Harryflintia acetispora TaxID=1849041 RepID=A0A9X8UID5_9FIRM|nr:glycosyltransferase family 2 protein [Harryflintia acetispora]TCL41898.1 cellulose synthase/poly-beta-1,6-N-acetylglucosamine synthase-like glycosyltransferase [Harryflintia acetispora]
MTPLDLLLLAALICIWLLLLINVVLIVGGYRYYVQSERYTPKPPEEYPMVSVMVPAHNEGVVIVRTVLSLLDFDYPPERYEIIVINDNSSDNSAELLEDIQRTHPERNLTVINTGQQNGGKGKSNALNIGFAQCSGEYVVIYDADNTPEPAALRLLVSEICADDSLGAVIGKFRTRNKEQNLLTRFINIETLAFQWMAQAGRWKLMGLCTIPGTNFIIRRKILEEMGGWDIHAIAEDTEISFRIYRMGYKIKFLPQAVTWEQEPQTLKVWFRQRTRWVKGNIYVLIKNLPLLFDPKAKKVRFDILYFLSIYFLLLTSLVVSDGVLLLNMLGMVHTTLAGFSNMLWLLAIVLFILGTYVTITTEKGEMSFSNLLVIAVMYFTYSKLWMAVAVYGLLQYVKDKILRRETKWYKTERFA